MKMFKLFALLIVLMGIMIFIGCPDGVITVQAADETEAIDPFEVLDPDDIEIVIPEVLTQEQREGMGLGTLSHLSWLDDQKTTLYVKIFSGLSVSDVSKLYNDLTYIIANEPQVLFVDMWMNSPGGDAFSGLALADIILNFRDKGLHIEAHANGIIASAAVPVFASCTVRYASKGTIFMVHEAALWKWPGRESASDIRSQNRLMEVLQDLYIGYLEAPATKLSHDEWVAKERATTWFTAEDALEWGLVDHLE
ncbi:MAG: ATP-dependent Clp protease proteolytic subunit [Actinomycetia bacterium]|nr:ATP-dependent Clp protease proteolytic subunit [Actinomycetes bacterium]